MYRVRLWIQRSRSRNEAPDVVIERPNLGEVLFRATDYVEAEVMGSWFSSVVEPYLMGFPLYLEVTHVNRGSAP